MIVAGFHSVKEALRASGRRVERLWILKGARGQRLQEVIDLARGLEVPLQFEPSHVLAQLAQGVRHPVVVARIGAVATAQLSEIIRGDRDLLLLADSVEDPRNLGALIRSAEASGASGLLLPERRCCGVSQTVVETSAGAALHLPIVRVRNSVQAVTELKKEGFWSLGLGLEGEESLLDVDLTVPLVLVVGGESRGLRPALRKVCDHVVKLPMLGRVESLNVSVAAGVVLYQIVFERKRRRSAHDR